MLYAIKVREQKLYISLITLDAVFMILCKQQDILVIIPTACMVWLLLKRFGVSRVIRGAWEIGFVFLIGVLFISNQAGGNNTTYNVISMDLLNYSKDPVGHLKSFGMSDDVAELFATGVGENPFNNGMPRYEYDEFFTRKNELKIIINEPSILPKMIINRANLLFRDDVGLGNYMKASGAVPKEKTRENRLWSNIKTWFYGSGIAFYLLIIVISLIVIGVGILNGIYSMPKDLFLIYLMLPISNVLRFITVMLGDSSHDDLKHFFMINIEFDVIYLVNLCLIIYFVLQKLKNNKRTK